MYMYVAPKCMYGSGCHLSVLLVVDIGILQPAVCSWSGRTGWLTYLTDMVGDVHERADWLLARRLVMLLLALE